MSIFSAFALLASAEKAEVIYNVGDGFLSPAVPIFFRKRDEGSSPFLLMNKKPYPFV